MADQYISPEDYHTMQQVSSQPNKTHVTVTSRTVAAIVLAVVLCSISFVAGMSFQKHHGAKTTVADGMTATNSHSGFSGQHRGGSLGSVTAINTASITITNQRTNAAQTFAINNTTVISNNGQTVSTTDIKTGDSVAITTSATDTATASRILINPNFGGGFGGPAGSSAPDSSQSN